MKIKICGLHNVNNLKQVLELNPDFIGLNFYRGSKRFCTWTQLPDLDFKKTKIVGVFVNAPLNYIAEKIKDFNLTAIQLHGTESLEEIAALRYAEPGCKFIKVFGVEERQDLTEVAEFDTLADYYLFDKKAVSFGGTGKKFDWDLLHQIKINKEFFLAGGIGPDDARAVQMLGRVLPKLSAVDINSRFEDKEGIKQVGLIEKFMKELS